MLADMNDALEYFRKEGFLLVMDSLDRENECDLVLSADHATKEKMAFMIRYSTGIICMVSDEARMDHFGLHKATMLNTDKNATNFYVATDYLPGTTTGVSAMDRVITLKAFANLENKAEDFSKPGHMYPLCAKPGGVLERGGHTESAYDLCRFAGVNPVSAIGELMTDEGDMYRLDDALAFSEKHKIPIITVEQIQEYAREQLKLNGESPSFVVTKKEEVVPACSISLEDMDEKCKLQIFEGEVPGEEVAAVIKGDVAGKTNVPVRIHSECFTGDLLGSKRCDCGQQLKKFMRYIDSQDCGILLYCRGHEGRGIGLANKIRAYNLQDCKNLDTVDANLALGLASDSRNYGLALDALAKLNVESIKLFTNNPLKISAMKAITQEVRPLETIPFDDNLKYMRTKEHRMNHKTVLATLNLPQLKGPVSRFTIGIVHTNWNDYYVRQLLNNCVAELESMGVMIQKMVVPGAFDLVAGAKCMLRKNCVNAIIALGVLIKGETDVYEHNCSAVAAGLTHLNATADIPIVNGVMMCPNEKMCAERCEGKNNPGNALARAAIQMVSITVPEEQFP